GQILMRELDRKGILEGDRVRRGLRVIDQETNRLTYLIARVLDFAQLESGTLRLVRQQADLVPLVRRVTDSLRERAALVSGATTVEIACHTIETAWTRLDIERFEQVLDTLLDNALRYSPSI